MQADRTFAYYCNLLKSPDIVAQKVCNRILYLFSSGSPIGYVRKSALYVLQPFEYLQRRKTGLELASHAKELQKPLAELDQTGQTLITADIDPVLLKELQTAADARVRANPDGQALVNRDYFGQILGSEDFTTDSIFVRFALQEKLLKIIAAYFGQVPKLSTVHLLVSKPTQSKTWSESQLWHRDYDDLRTVKVFVYLSDVENAGSGPFTFLSPGHSKKVKNDLIPKRITDEAMEKQGCAKYAISIYGKKGTAFLIDTAQCYHMGSRCIDKRRLAFVATFNTMAPLQKNGVSYKDRGNLTPFQKMFLNDV